MIFSKWSSCSPTKSSGWLYHICEDGWYHTTAFHATDNKICEQKVISTIVELLNAYSAHFWVSEQTLVAQSLAWKKEKKKKKQKKETSKTFESNCNLKHEHPY